MAMVMVLLTMGVFLGTTDRGELYLLLYIDLNTEGSLRFFGRSGGHHLLSSLKVMVKEDSK